MSYANSCRIIHNDTRIKGRVKTSLTKIYLSLYCNVCMWEGAGDQTELQYFDPHSYGRQRCVSRAAQPEAQGLRFLLSAGFLYHILSATLLDPNSSGGPESPFGLVWLSLPAISSLTPTPDFLSWLSYIIQRPLNPWNGMFDHHQTEITVMQFTGHSLPVHQSMSVPRHFFYLVPFHQPNPTYTISFDYWPLGCVTFFRCITLEWHICLGRRSKYNIIIILLIWVFFIPVLADGFQLKSEWQQVPSSLLDSF